MVKKITNLLFLSLIICVSTIVLLSACSGSGDIKHKLLGKWKTDAFSWEITETGKILYDDPTAQLSFDYTITKEGSDDIITLKMNSDSVKFKVTFIDNSSFKITDLKNPANEKVFKKIK